MVAAVCVAIVLAPVSVLATSSPSKVYITDPHHSSYRASVSPTGALSVGGTVNVGNLPATQNVSGNVNVGNLPATQNVSGSVNVGNLPATQNVSGNVNVGNLPATQNVSGSVTATPGLPGTPFTATFSTIGATASVTVPTGKHFVVQTLSVFAEVNAGDKVDAEFSYTTNGTAGTIYFPLTYVYTFSGHDYYEGTALQVDLYADPTTTVGVHCYSTGSNSLTTLTASGYLTS
jgi:hypothetical protein